MGLKDTILAASDLKTEAVEVPEWGCTVYVRTMPGAERDAFEQFITERTRDGRIADVRGVRSALLVRTLADENGELIFTESDAKELEKKSAVVLNRLTEVAQRMNALSDREVEDLAKN